MYISQALRWFAGGANGYHNLSHCMNHDYVWIAITVALDLAVAGGYVIIARHWGRNERILDDGPAKTSLNRLKKIFILCGICGYIFIPIKMVWPAWRLYDMVLAVLVYITWRYALGTSELKVIYQKLSHADRLINDLRESHADREQLEEQVKLRTAELESAVEALQLEVADRKRGLSVLSDERNLLHTLIDALPDLIYVKDLQGRYVLNNTAHLQFLGATSPEQIAGKTAFDLFPRDLAEQFHADDLRVRQCGETVIREAEPTVDAAGKRAMDVENQGAA